MSVKRLGRQVLQRVGVGLLVYLIEYGLRTSGWLRSSRLGRPVTATGEPLPWYTYSAMHFLESRLTSDMRVFEFGSGHSTLWYAARTGEVVSVEHERSWADMIAKEAPLNSTVCLREDLDAYAAEITCHDGTFDIVAIDGIARPRCAEATVDNLKDNGVIVWDNSDRPEFEGARQTIQALRSFKELRFTGFGPCGHIEWSTSILYRRDNCLGI